MWSTFSEARYTSGGTNLEPTGKDYPASSPQPRVLEASSLSGIPPGSRVVFTLLSICLALAMMTSPIAGYDSAGHFYTTGIAFYGLEQPMASADANMVTFCAWLPDETQELSATSVYSNLISHPIDYGFSWAIRGTGPPATVGKMVVVQQLLHGLSGGDSLAVTAIAQGLVRDLLNAASQRQGPERFNRLCAAGFGLHLLGDSFAHRQLDAPGRMYPTGRGHAGALTHPDHPLYCMNREADWESYIDAVVGPARAIRGVPTIKSAARGKVVSSPCPSNTPDDNEEWLRGMLIGELTNLAGPQGPRFIANTTQKPCQDYVGDNVKAGAIANAPDCRASWLVYCREAVRAFALQSGSRAPEFSFPEFYARMDPCSQIDPFK